MTEPGPVRIWNRVNREPPNQPDRTPEPSHAAVPTGQAQVVPGDDASDARVRRDGLVTRLLDGRASSLDWRALRSETASDPQMWIELIDISELGEGLGQSVKAAQERAALVELPARASEPAVAIQHEAGRGVPGSGFGSALGSARGSGVPEHGRAGVASLAGHRRASRSDRMGWLVAVLLGVGLVTVAVKPRVDGARSGDLAGVRGGAGGGVAAAGLASADEAMQRYLEIGQAQGRVVGEVPQRIILESRELPDGGGREVLYIRQLIERAVVDDLYKVGTDDQGRPVVVPQGDGHAVPRGL